MNSVVADCSLDDQKARSPSLPAGKREAEETGLEKQVVFSDAACPQLRPKEHQSHLYISFHHIVEFPSETPPLPSGRRRGLLQCIVGLVVLTWPIELQSSF